MRRISTFFAWLLSPLHHQPRSQQPPAFASYLPSGSYWLYAPPPWVRRSALPAPNILANCDQWQRNALDLAVQQGVVAHRIFAQTARGAGVRVYTTLVIGDGYGHAYSDQPEYQVGVECYLRVEPIGRVICECAAGGEGDPCGHAGAILLQLLAAHAA
jgi:hypothetical protein